MGKANRYFTEEFKMQIVALRLSEKTISELAREYKISEQSGFLMPSSVA